MDLSPFIVPPDTRIRLDDYDPGYTGDYTNKKHARKRLKGDIARLAELQDVLYAHNRFSLLLIFQAMDAAGKDSAIKHVMSGVNPQGCQVFSFKQPSAEELDHDFMWRYTQRLPERGRIGIFNRSYYEETLVVRVHPKILAGQHIPGEFKGDDIWKRRFETFNNLESYLARNGTHVIKFFLHVSKEEQAQRFLDRINRPEKNWKFSNADMRERGFWDDYMGAFEEVFAHTSTEAAPWYIVPADHKWFSRVVVSTAICHTLSKLNLDYPVVDPQQQSDLGNARVQLESELVGTRPDLPLP
jgi:PPK2 family polyphosphate:nucleotide phosphotransferase